MMMMMMMMIIIIIIIMGAMSRHACGVPAYNEHGYSKSFDLGILSKSRYGKNEQFSIY